MRMWMWRMMWMRGRKREGKEMDGGQWGDRGTSSLTTPRYDDSPPIIPPILLIPGKLSSYHTLNNLSTHICLLPGNLLSFSQRLMLRTEHLQFDPQKLLLLISSGATPVAVESVMCRLQLIVAAVLCLDVSASALPDSHFLWKQMEESDFPPWWQLVWTPQHCHICTFLFYNTGGSTLLYLYLWIFAISYRLRQCILWISWARISSEMLQHTCVNIDTTLIIFSDNMIVMSRGTMMVFCVWEPPR